MAVTNNFAASSLDLNGKIAIKQPTALVWGPDGRLYVTEADGDVRVLTVAFGDKDPLDGDDTAQFYVTEALTVGLVKGAIQNHNDDGTQNAGQNRQVTGIDVTRQFDADGNPVMIDGTPAATIYVTSSDSRIGAGGSGGDINLDTNSGVITKMVQTGPNTWDAIDIVRGLPRSEENHATNGLEVIQVLDGDGKLVSERMIVAAGGNANTGAPSNNFAGQQEQPLSGALIEVDLDALKALPVLDDNGRAYVYDLPTLDDATRPGDPDSNDPFGGNDGLNSAKLLADGPVSIYSPGYRNAYDVEVSDDGRVWTYDNGANNSWGGRPIGEAGDDGGATDFMQALGYIATNLNNGEGNASDPINLVNWNPSNKDNFHEATRSDDLDGRDLSAGQGGAQTFEHDGLTYVYGGHPNPTRAEGALAGLLFSRGSGANNAYLLVSDQDSYADDDLDLPDYDAVIDWFETVEAANPKPSPTSIYGVNPGDLTKKVLAVTPGVLYDIYSFADGSGEAVVDGGAAPADGTFLGKAGLPADIADIVAYRNAIEGDYKEAGKTDGALDTGNGSINGLTEYTSTIMDEGGVKMSGAIIAAQLNGGNLIIMGRNADGTMSSGVSGGFAVAADRTTFQTNAKPLGLTSIGDDFIERGLTQPFQGSIWVASYSTTQPFIQILQPDNGAVPLAGQEIVNPTDRDLDGIDNINDPFEFSAENGFALAPGEQVLIDFNPQNANFPNTISATGLLGAALDGVTPNRDAQTVNENFTGDQVLDGLYDIGGNILPGGNAPILQIKKVVAGTVVGAANSARDALHTGIRPSDDTDRIVATIAAKNWILEKAGEAEPGQLTGMMFGDGTQSNFVRFVFGSVDGALGFEVGVEIDDVCTVLAQVAVPALATAGVNTIDMRLTLDKKNGFAVTAEYRLEGQDDFTALDLGGFVLPAGVLRDVLTGDHTIGDGAAEQTSGAAIGFLAENVPGAELDAVDFYSLRIEAFGNEIVATDGDGVGAPGSPDVDTVVYTGPDTVLAPLAPDVENFDGTGSTADFTVIANDLDNVIRPGTGANVITTGAGADTVRGTLDQLAGDEITDFATDDTVLVEGALINDFDVTYAAGSAILTINAGPTITFSGPDFADFDPLNGDSTFNFTQTQDGVEVSLVPDEVVLYRVNAGDTVTAIDDGPDWFGDNGLSATPTNGMAKIGGKGSTFSNAITDSADEVDFDNVDPTVVPWQVFVEERGQGIPSTAAVEYTFAVQVGTSYKIEYFYTENWQNIFGSSAQRIFDVQIEGAVPAAFEDIHPLRDATDFVDGPGAPLPVGANAPSTAAEKQPYNGVANKAEYTYTATDDTLNIVLVNNTQEAKVNAIQITQLGGSVTPPADTTAPVIASIAVENPQNVQDGPRAAVVVLTDETGFDASDFAGLDGAELTFTGIVPDSVSAPAVVLSDGGKTATLTYTLTAAGNSWPNGVGEIAIAAGAYGDAAGNASAAAGSAFVLQNNLNNLERGAVVRAINVGTTDTTLATNLGPDLVEGGTDNNRYGGAIAADSLITDAFGNPIAFEADDNAWYTSPKSNAQLNANVDGQSGSTGSNSGGVDLDGSAYHTYRDSAAGTWTATYSGFAPGTYIVELHFAELFHTTGGNRQGDFTLNGQPLALDFDPFTAAGGADRPTAPLRKAVTVTDGDIVVGVSADTGQPGYSAIVVYAAADPNLPPTISVEDVQAVEGGDAVITVTRIGDLTEAVTVTFDVTPGTADASDYTAPVDMTVTIPAGQGTASITIPIVDDTIEEGAETFTVEILSVSTPSDTAVIADGTATVTIAASDSPIQAPVGTTIFELDFEGVEGEALDVGGFDGALGTSPTVIDEATSQITGGKLVVQTAEGDINDGTNSNNASINDFTKSVDLSDPDLTEIFLTTRFDNPFDGAFFDANGLTGTTVPNYAQQGIVLGTGTQLAGEMVKLVWGGVAGSQTGVQMWTKGSTGIGLSQSATLAAMAPGTGTLDVAAVELTLRIDKTAGTVAQYVTLFDAEGAILGGTRPDAAPGFATAAPVTLPAAVLANLDSTTETTHVGVHSTDNSSPVDQVGSFEATWDFVRLSSPQFPEPSDPPVEDTAGPTATVTLAAPVADADPIVATVVYADASDIDPDSIDAADLTLTGPRAPGAVTLVSFDAVTNTAVYSFAAPAEGWAEGAYTATVAGGEIADLAATPNTNVGGETGGATLSFEDEPVAEYTPGTVIRAVNVGGPAIANDPILGIALEADDITIIDPVGAIYVDGAAGSDPGIAANLAGSALASERYGTTLTLNMANPDGSPLANGTYFVEIHLAELFQIAENERRFDVSIEGTQVADDLDLVAETNVTATSSQPYVISQAVEVTDGFATVVLDASAAASGLDNAKIGALVIREAVPVDPPEDVLVSLTGVPEIVENADGTPQGEQQNIPFTLSVADAAFTGTLDLTLSVNGVETPASLAFTAGVATYMIPAQTDTRWTGPEFVSVTLLSVETPGYAVDTATASATTTVTEDDPADSHDIAGAAPVVVGDFSDDRENPTDIGALGLGDNVIVASQQGDDEPGGRDRDYFTFTVAEGQVLSQLVLQGFETEDSGLPQGFIGIQAGPVVTVDPVTQANAGDLLGGLVYNDGLLNNDILDDLADGETQGVSFIGFETPLPAGTYTVWLNQGGIATTATLNFVVAEAPPPPALVRGDVVAAFNAGGPALIQDGIDFAAATNGTDGAPFSSGQTYTDGDFGQPDQPVFDGTVYETEMNSGGDADNLLNFSTADGIDPTRKYFVDLYFAEIFESQAGSRVFSVTAEGAPLLQLTSFNVVNASGDVNAPVVVQLTDPIDPGANGRIDLTFLAETERAKVSAIVIREAVAPQPDGVIGIADAPTLEETGDTGSTTLLFPLTITGPAATATLTFTVNGVEQSAEVSFTDGAGVLGVDVPNDDVDTGDTDVTVVLTGVTEPGFTIGAATATGTVTEDDTVVVDPDDIDGDGVANTLDPSAYDAANGAANTLAKGATISLDFDTPTDDVFDPSTGLTGVMVNLAGLNVNATPDDIYGTLTNEATSSINGDGFLQVASSSQDAFATGIGANNAQKDAYQAMFDVSGNDNVRFETRVKNPFDTEPASFLSLGLQIGAGDMDSFVKFVFGGQNGTGANGATRIQIGHNTSLAGSGNGETNVSLAQMFDAAALADGGYADYNALLADIDTVVLAVEVDRSAAPKTLKGVWTFENAAGDAIYSGTTVDRTIVAGSKLDLALDGLNPNTGGTGGVAFGVMHTDWNSGTQTAADTFTAQFDYLRAISLDAVPNDPPSAVTLTPVITEIAENTVLDTALKVADIAVTDDGFGTNMLALTGAQADLFEIAGMELFLKAGTVLDFETLAALEVAISVDDIAVGSTPDATSAPFVLAVTDVNEAPTLTVTPVVTEIAEDADTTAAIVIATITVTDDALGTNDLTLTGADAGLFEINGTDLVLKAGTALDFETQASFDVSVVLDDAEIGTEPEATVSVTLTVTDVNEVPTVVAPLPDQTPPEDAPFSFAIPAGTFADDAGEAGLTLAATLADDSPLPAWLSFDPVTATFSGTPLQADVDAGAITVKVTATDAGGLAVSDDFTLTPQNVNDAPTIDGTLDPVETTAGTGTSVDLSGLTLDDEDGDPLTLAAQLQGGAPLPAGITLVGAALAVADDTPEGVYPIDIFADDGELTSASPVSVTITVGAAPNEAPTVAAPLPDQTPDEDAPFSFTVPAGTFADDAGEAGLMLAATLADDSPLPAWLSFDPVTATFSGTPLQADVDAGAITVRVTATDAGGLAVSDDFTLTPQNVNDAPTIDGTLAPLNLTEGTSGTVDLSALTLADEDGTTPTLLAQLQGGDPLPAGITLDGASLNVADTAPAGVYTIDVFADDGELTSATPVSVTVVVTSDTGGEQVTPVTISDPALSNYWRESQSPEPDGYEIAPDGSAITFTGNTWKKMALPDPYTVTGQSLLRFEFSSTQVTEMLVIGLENDNDVESGEQLLYQIAGTQSFAPFDRTYFGYSTDDGVVTIEIDLSAHAGKSYSHLVLVNDMDRGSGNGTFANVAFVEAGNRAPSAGDDLVVVQKDGELRVAPDILLVNDTDPDGDPLTVTGVFGAVNGDVAIDTITGQIVFTPTPGATGTGRFGYTIADPDGSVASATVTVTILEPGDGEIVTPIDFNVAPIESYSTQDTRPGTGFVTSDDGTALTVDGNVWKRTDLPSEYTLTENSVLRFEVRIDTLGEIHAIGFDNDDDFRDGAILFQLAGTQTLAEADQSFRTYTDLGTTVFYEISLAGFAGQSFETINFINDHDRRPRDALTTFSNVELVEVVTVIGSGEAPEIFGGTIGPRTVQEDVPFEIILPIFDNDTPDDDLVFIYDNLPDFLTAEGAALFGTADNADVGSYEITVTARDPEANQVTDTFTLTVENTNDAPEVNGTLAPVTAFLGSDLAINLPAGLFTDPDVGDTLSYALDGAPAGLTIDPVTGRITGAPEDAGSFTVSVIVSDGALSAQTSFVLDVAASPPQESVLIEAEGFTGFTEPDAPPTNFFEEFVSNASGRAVIRTGIGESASISTDLDTAGVVPGFYDISIVHYDETDGVSSLQVLIDQGDGAGSRLVGEFLFDKIGLPGQGVTVQRGNIQTFVVPQVEIQEGARLILQGVADAMEVLRIDHVVFDPVAAPDNAPPVFDSAAEVTLAENTLAVTTVQATDPEEDTLSYAIAGGADAALFQIGGTTGDLAFIAAPDFETPGDGDGDGVYDVVVSATDGANTVEQAVAVTVANVNEAPVGTAPSPLAADLGAPVALPTLNSLFVDPDAGDTLSYTVGGLPAGVSLGADGITLEGTPTALGVSTVTVTATDAGGLTDSVSFDLAVVDPDAFDPADYAPDSDLDGDGVPNADDDDVDGDGIPNIDDPFAYDAENGMTLVAGETKTYDFGLDGTIFENGMTGFLQGTANGGNFNEDTGAASVSGGLLTIDPVTSGDTGTANNPQDDPQVGVKNGTFTATSVILNPWFGDAPNPNSFDQLGMHIGLDSLDMVKLVFGQSSGVVEFQKQDNGVSTKYGGASPTANVPFPAGVNVDNFAKVVVTFEVESISPASATVTGTAAFLAEDDTVLATQVYGTAPIGGALAAALADPTIGVGVGFTQVDGGGAPTFVAQMDSLSITAPGAPVEPDETDPPTAAITLTNPATTTDPLRVDIALTDASGIDTSTLGAEDLALAVNGFPVAADISFTGFADGVASYAIAAPAVGWAEGLPVSVTLKAGEVADFAAVPNVNAAASASLAIAIGGGGGGGTDTVVYRINAYGTEIASIDGGPVWAADGDGTDTGTPNPYFTATDVRGDAFGYSGDPAAIPDGIPAGVFDTARSSDLAFGYDLPVSLLGGGEDYEVRLYFAETFTGSTAQTGGFRNFDATLEGFVLPAFDNIDPGSLFGADAGVITGQVKVTDGTLNIGFVQDIVQNPIINAIEVVALASPVENPAPPVNPGNALDAFASQGDLFTGASYGGAPSGAAILKIMAGNNSVAASNFGSNSFQVENIGAKNISAVFIDVSAALYPDSVFDPDGLGGDNAAKDWAINSAGNTGGYVTGTGYFLPGPDPIPNSGGSGGPSNGGFKGAMVKFNPNVDGGFDPGEIVGFSGDMDPNSIAGMAKGGTTGVDSGAIQNWDVGGISGHELIGSLFTVLFDDGSTASGQLMGDQSNAGAIAIAAQNLAPSGVTLTVNGVGAGGVGTYGGTTPTVIVTGDPGELVRVTLTRGLDPVTNTTNGIADLVEARLARYDFKVNNAFDEQSVDVTIGATGTFDASALFDYGTAQNTGKGSFAGDTVAPIGFVASAIGTVSGDVVPTGPVTAPIYLTNQGGPVTGGSGGSGGTGTEGYFALMGSGSAARFKIQIEDENANGGQTPGGKWNFVSAPDGAGRQSGFQGDGYYVYGSETSTAINNVIANEILTYDIFIPEGETGVYSFRLRASRDGQEAGDQQNDLWLNFFETGTNNEIADYLVLGGNEPEPTNQGFIKIFGGPNNGSWGNVSSWDGVPNNPSTQLSITEAGLYTIEIAGRSQGFHVDYFELYKGGAPGTGASDSAFIEGAPGDTGGGTTPGGDLVIPIAASADDWEERGGAGSNDLELGDNGGQQYVGLRFNGITIPAGSTIASAYIAFEAQETSSGMASFSIAMETTENAATYTGGTPPGGRSYTDEFIWTPGAWTDGQTYETPDLTDLILSVIGDDGVTDGEFGFLIDGISGSRVAHPFDSGTGEAPTLFILFEDTIA